MAEVTIGNNDEVSLKLAILADVIYMITCGIFLSLVRPARGATAAAAAEGRRTQDGLDPAEIRGQGSQQDDENDREQEDDPGEDGVTSGAEPIQEERPQDNQCGFEYKSQRANAGKDADGQHDDRKH